MGLRDLIEKQKAEKAAVSAPVVAPVQVEPEPVQPQIQPESAPGPKSMLDRFKRVAPAAPIVLANKTPIPVGSQITNSVIEPAPQTPPPTGPTANIEKLRENLVYLANNIEQKELVGQVVRTIAIQLKENPQFGEQLVDADFDLIIRGLRRSFQIAARAKTERREKTATKSALSKELDQALQGLDLGQVDFGDIKL